MLTDSSQKQTIQTSPRTEEDARPRYQPQQVASRVITVL